MPQALIAFDTDQIKGYVFATGKLKEIRGASSLLDDLNRVKTPQEANKLHARKIYAHGGSALFLVASKEEAEQLGKAVQKLYRTETGGGASITYAVQPLPDCDVLDIMTAKDLDGRVTMLQMLQMLHWRLRLAKDGQSDRAGGVAAVIAQPSHPFLCPCEACGAAYAKDIQSDPDKSEGRYCRACLRKRNEDEGVRHKIPDMIYAARSAVASHQDEDQDDNLRLWERIFRILSRQDAVGGTYSFSNSTQRPPDFNAFRDLTSGKAYMGLIYADANNIGKAILEQETLQGVQRLAEKVDRAVFKAVGDAIRRHLPVHNGLFPFDILLIGGDDIVMAVPADKALLVASTLAQAFQQHTDHRHTLSVSVVLAPITYPFNLQRTLADDILKNAKKAGAMSRANGGESQEQARISFVVITGTTSLSYQKIYDGMYREDQYKKEEFRATMRPYTLDGFSWLLKRLKEGHEKRLGRTKLHQMHDAILKLNCTTTIFECLALFRNWKQDEREFLRELVEEFDTLTPQQKKRYGPLFPWYLESKEQADANNIYRTPLLDFIELYDFVSS